MFSRLFRRNLNRNAPKTLRKVARAIHPVVERMEDRTLYSFTVPGSYAPGTTPTSVLVGDFNGDSKPDLVQLNAFSPTINVLLGNGDGTFQAPISSTAGGIPIGMTMGDYNHDGKLDIATTQGATIEILDGNGDGTFQLPVVNYVGAYANDIKTGDFNNDGCDDLVTASFQYGGTSQIFLNDGTGTLLPARNLAINSLGKEVEVADLNDDGNLDLVETSGGYGAGILYGRGNGTFQSISAISLGTVGLFSTNMDLKIADLNKDGHPDIVDVSGSNLNVISGNGNGTFQTPVTYPLGSSPTSLQIADLNGDGNKDIIANNGQVAYGRGDGSFYAPVSSGITGGHIATGDFNGDGGVDLVATSPTGAASGVGVSLNANNDVQLLAGATGLSVNAAADATAGNPFAVTITALDSNGNVDPAFQGTVGVSGAAGTVPVSYTFSAADNGVHTIANAATLFTSGLQTYSVTSPFLSDNSGTVNVHGGAVAKVTVAAQATSVAGDVTSLTVSALDAYGNATNGYLGTVRFSSSDIQAGLPADYTFIVADAGVQTFNVTLKTAGGQTVTATDTATATIAGVSTPITVAPTVAAGLGVSGGGGFIGSVNAIQIVARDIYGNVATGYNGVVHLATSDINSPASSDAALANGVGTFTVTPMTLGGQTLTASDIAASSIAGSEDITVTPGWGARFAATPLASTVAGQTQTTTLTVYDLFGDVSTVFTGYVAIATTDPQAPFNYVYFSPADAGVETIAVTLYTAGTQAVTISDYYNPGVTVTQTGINVAPAGLATIQVTPLQGTVAGVVQNSTVSARDAYGNLATNYRGTLNFTSSDTLATLPADYTFTAADAGSHTFAIAFKSSGGQSISIVDTSNPLSLNYIQRDIAMTPAALSTFAFKSSSISNTTAGAVLSLTVSATDAYGNAINGYTGTALLSSTDAQITLPAGYTFTGADAGAHTFSVALKTAGSQTITATDSATSTVTGSVSSTVKAAATSKFSLVTATSATSGVAQSLTVSAIDAYGNVSTGYTGTVKMSSSDAQASLPANYTFTNKDGGVHTFTAILKTPGSQSITATDAVNAGITVTQAGIVVTASVATVASLGVSGFAATTAGTAKTFVVTAKDAAGNLVSGYTGTVVFSSSDVKAGLPASYTFTAADAGTHTFSATFKTAGTQSIAVKDAIAGTVAGSQTGIAITAGAAAQFVISAPASVTQGIGFKFTVSVYDAFGNLATGYRGKVHLSSTDTKSGSSDYTFSSSDNGVHTFSYGFSTLGAQTLKLADSTNSSLLASVIVNVLAK
jgi:hypothetical protein